MKKFLVSMMAAFMVFAIAGSAAAFSNGSLTAVIYNKTDKEVALDLGSIYSLDFTQQNVTLKAAGSFSLSDFSASITSFDDLSVGLFARDGVGFYGYFATTSETAPGATGNLNNFLSASNSVMTNYGAANTKAVKLASATNGYTKKMNLNGNTPGSYSGLNVATTLGEAVLPEDGFVDMYLYKYQVATAPGVGSYLASFRISTDGSIVMNAASSTVPVPGAFILLFSGLLGLVGIRRKA